MENCQDMQIKEQEMLDKPSERLGESIVRETTADTPTRHYTAAAATKPDTELLTWLGFCFCTEMKPIRIN